VWRVVGVGGAGVVGGRQRDTGGVVSSLPWCGFGVMADTGEMACLLELSATAALCGRQPLTAGFQTITLNICKQIKKKQNQRAQMETSVFLPFCTFSFTSPLGVLRRRARVATTTLGLPWPHLFQPLHPNGPTRHREIRSARGIS
jgi:hypothetical protein